MVLPAVMVWERAVTAMEVTVAPEAMAVVVVARLGSAASGPVVVPTAVPTVKVTIPLSTVAPEAMAEVSTWGTTRCDVAPWAAPPATTVKMMPPTLMVLPPTTAWLNAVAATS